MAAVSVLGTHASTMASTKVGVWNAREMRTRTILSSKKHSPGKITRTVKPTEKKTGKKGPKLKKSKSKK